MMLAYSGVANVAWQEINHPYSFGHYHRSNRIVQFVNNHDRYDRLLTSSLAP